MPPFGRMYCTVHTTQYTTISASIVGHYFFRFYDKYPLGNQSINQSINSIMRLSAVDEARG
jgi:hypothetical protein